MPPRRLPFFYGWVIVAAAFGTMALAAGNLYVADREQGRVVRLDPTGKLLDPNYVSVMRPRLPAVDTEDRLWVGGDGPAEAPWQQGPGEIWRVSRQGVAALVTRGPIAAGMGVGPGGTLFVADRQGARVFVLMGDGQRVEFLSAKDGTAPRSLGWAPVTAETRRVGIAGDLFVVAIPRGAWQVNEVIRVSGPFEDFLREARTSR